VRADSKTDNAIADHESSRGNASASIRERFAAWRNRIVASRRFQRWAAGFPLTRPVARARAGRLFDLCAGFVYSQILYACVRLELLEFLEKSPATTTQVAHALSLPEDGARRLLAGAAALKLIEPRGHGTYGLAMDGAALLGNPGALAMIRHHPHFYDDLRDPVALLRGQQEETALSRFWGYASGENPTALGAEEIAQYTELMAASQSLIAEDILDGYDMSRHTHLMDVGGGDGTFIAAAAARHARLRLSIFDLPSVTGRAAQRLEEAGLTSRVSLAGGDFFTDRLPPGADIVTLVRVLLDHDDTGALAILRNVRAALPRGGVLLVAETLSGVRGAETISDAYFGFYLLAMGKGRPRTVGRIRDLMTTAGFRSAQVVPTRRPLLTQLIMARR